MKKLYLLLLLALPLFVKAGTVSISGNKTISPGETATLSIIVSSSNKIVGAQVKNITLSTDDFEIVSIKQASTSHDFTKGTNSFIVYAKPNGESVNYIANKGAVAKIGVKAKSTATPGATATLTLKNASISTIKSGGSIKDADDEDCPNYATTLTVGAVKSTNNNLASLEITDYTLAFSATKTSYTISSTEVGKALTVKATAEDAKATVKVSSPKLAEGSNTITVTVTAESGAKKTYTITVNVPKKEEVKNTAINLKTLEVVGYNINFNPDKTDYLLNVEHDVENIEINATLEDSESSKVIDGPKYLKDGENNYYITVTDKNGKRKTYGITVNRKEAKVECEECKTCEPCEEGSSDTVWKFLAIALVIVTLAETIFMVTMRDKKKI